MAKDTRYPAYQRRPDHFASPYQSVGAKKPKCIAWVSQHAMAPVQMGALKRMYGDDVEVVQVSRQFNFQNAETIVRELREQGFDDSIVVAPYSVLDRMCQLGLRPLWAEAEQVFGQTPADWSVKGRHYRFTGYKRVKRLVLELEDLGPEARRQEND